jgi:hypothetical protein
MHDRAFDTVTRRATTLSRRRWLRVLGGAGLASALAAPAATSARKVRKKVRNTCQQHAAQCRAGVEDSCTGNAACLEGHLPCCEHFAQCRADVGVVCLSTGAPLPAV